MNVDVRRIPECGVTSSAGQWTGCFMGNVEPTFSRINGKVRISVASMGTEVVIEFTDEEFATLLEVATKP